MVHVYRIEEVGSRFYRVLEYTSGFSKLLLLERIAALGASAKLIEQLEADVEEAAAAAEAANVRAAEALTAPNPLYAVSKMALIWECVYSPRDGLGASMARMLESCGGPSPWKVVARTTASARARANALP